MRYRLPKFAVEEKKIKSKLPIGKCERCGRKKPLATFWGKDVCSEGCYVKLNHRRRCPYASKRDDQYRGNKFKKFDDELFNNSELVS